MIIEALVLRKLSVQAKWINYQASTWDFEHGIPHNVCYVRSSGRRNKSLTDKHVQAYNSFVCNSCIVALV